MKLTSNGNGLKLTRAEARELGLLPERRIDIIRRLLASGMTPTEALATLKALKKAR